MLEGKNILVGITGGIAAYKICSLIRLYKKEGASVRVVVTPNALKFVTKLTLQTLSNNEVYVEQFDIDEYKPEHIALTDADIFVIAPATANTIGKIANGICDNLLSTTACAFNKPFLIAPAMNNNMWENKFVQENIKKLEENGYNLLYPSEGFLACGTNAVGRMREPEEIFDATVKILNNQDFHNTNIQKSGKLSGKKILITAGGTREKIDPVRYITNSSSGKMGIALANTAAGMGAEVTLISTFGTKGSFKNIVTETAQEMEQAVKENLFDYDCVIMAAAVSDYRVRNYSEQKIKKGAEDYLNLELVKNPDILREISNLKKIKIRSGEYATVCHTGEQENTQWVTSSEESKKDLSKSNLTPLIVGFCAESEHLIENAKIKVKTKGCDYIVANDISRKDIGFNSDENEVYIIDKNLNINHIEKDTKENIAKKILENIFE